jgi:hypothetical protein
MILYTTMPLEQVYPTENEFQESHRMITYQGIPMLVEITDQQSFQIVRVISSDPQHYMNDSCTPGSKISLANLDGLSSF